MATVSSFTKERMLVVENTTVVDGTVVGNDLFLVTRAGTQINAGNVRGPQGIQGPVGEVSTAALNAAITAAVDLVQAAGAVTTAMIAVSAITTNRLADSAVTTAKLADGAVTNAKIADGTILNAKLADETITGAKIVNGTIGNTEYADRSITGGKIAIGQVGNLEMGDGAITYGKQGFIFIQSSTPPPTWGGIWIIP